MDRRYDIDKIKSIPILDVAKELGITVKKYGTKYKAKCLWHADNNPSMVIGGRYNNCHCYACGKSWNAAQLIMQHENMRGLLDAYEWMAERWGSLSPALPRREGSHSVGWKTRKMEALMRTENGKCRMENEKAIYFNHEWVQARLTMDNSFVMCLKEVFGGNVAAQVVRDYSLCSIDARFGVKNVGFPLIDIHGRIRDIKVQGYQWDRRSDRFFHGNGTCYWLKSLMLKHEDIDRTKVFKESLPSTGRLGGVWCLFGEHLLRRDPDKVVALVESPKNACVGSAMYPELLWVATGNKNMLKREVLEVLHGRRVAVFPDADAYDEWKDKLETMQDIATFKVLPVPGDMGGKSDIADWILDKQKIAPQAPQMGGCNR